MVYFGFFYWGFLNRLQYIGKTDVRRIKAPERPQRSKSTLLKNPQKPPKLNIFKIFIFLTPFPSANYLLGKTPKNPHFLNAKISKYSPFERSSLPLKKYLKIPKNPRFLKITIFLYQTLSAPKNKNPNRAQTYFL